MNVGEVIDALCKLPEDAEVLTFSDAYYDLAVLGPVGYVGMTPDLKAVAIVQKKDDLQ